MGRFTSVVSINNGLITIMINYIMITIHFIFINMDRLALLGTVHNAKWMTITCRSLLTSTTPLHCRHLLLKVHMVKLLRNERCTVQGPVRTKSFHLLQNTLNADRKEPFTHYS